MRLYIRNKVKYDPLNSGKALLFVDFPDPRGFSVGQVKEEFKRKATAAKVDSLYHRKHDGSYEVLADDRTIGFYNIQDNAILETTSNPLWAAAIYYRLREVERDAGCNPDDGKTQRGLQQSCIIKYMALGILFNGGNNQERQQPSYFEDLDQLYEFLQTAGKKPVYMSQKTLDTLQTLKDEYEQNDVHEQDPIGHFVERQAVKLGLHVSSESTAEGDEQRSKTKGNGRNTGQRNRTAPAGVMAKGNDRGRKRIPQKQRTCEDCEENLATQFCSDCQPPLVLCDDCALVLHRGAKRRNHQLKDVSQAPTPCRSKGYTPKAYRAPFALLVAFHRASNEVPSKMSLTADELKLRAQPLTNTDLENKQGRWFGGFDSLENTLVKNELVLKEARTPKYSLMDKGQPLAARCSEFDYAVQNLTQRASVPTIPVIRLRPVVENRQICLLVDSEEPLMERFVRVANQKGLSAKTRRLPVGDFLWILLPPGANPDTIKDMPDQELVLPMLVERKTWDDLWSSTKTRRFLSQVQRMKACGLKKLFYLVEGSPKDLKGNPGPEVEILLKDTLDTLLLTEQFLVNRTGSWMKTVEWLCHLTAMSVEFLQADGWSNLMTYSEFSHRSRLRATKTLENVTATDSIVWSAAEFTDAIRRHSRGGRELHNLPICGSDGRSLIVIQGLTFYNKQCHNLLDKALANVLENSHEIAEACVQRYLHGVTDQLIHEDVMQWYILWLQVFKGVKVRRTESEEESADVLYKFYQGVPGDAVNHPHHNGDVGCLNVEPPESLKSLPDDDLIFASDSQEEDAMIRQALRASEYEGQNPSTSEENFHLPSIQPPRSTNREIVPPRNSCDGSHKMALSALDENEQFELALKLSKVENTPPSESLNPGLYPHVKPKTILEEPCMPTGSVVCNKKAEGSGADDDLEKALKLSLEEFQWAKQTHHLENNHANTDDDLEKALTLSKMEYEQTKMKSLASDSFDRDTELVKVLSLTEAEVRQSSSGGTCHTQNRETYSFEDELQSAKEASTHECKQKTVFSNQDGRKQSFGIGEERGKDSELSVIEPHHHCKSFDSDVINLEDSESSLHLDDEDYVFDTRAGSSKDSAVLLDSQEPDDTAEDFSYALKLQEDLNRELNQSKNNHHSPSSTKTATAHTDLNKQLVGYRDSQKEKYSALSRRKDKSSPGFEFRRNVAAIACGKPTNLATGRGCSRDDAESCKATGSTQSLSSTKRSSVATDSVRPQTSSARPFSSLSNFESVPKLHSPCRNRESDSAASGTVSSSSPEPSVSRSRRNDSGPAGPKCGACGETGHNKNSKICPQYFSAEAVQRREEQSRKRKAKREEEEREFNDRLGAMAAQRLSIEDQTRVLGEQLEQLRRQSQSMADTQKKVEDAIKRRKKR